MSLGSVLSVARSALTAQQIVIQTAGHNIANVETEGYSRQRVEMSPSPEQHWTYGSVGTGVQVLDIRRARDEMLDSGYRMESGGAAASQLRQELLTSVEGVLGEPSDTGLSAALDAFWSSWSDLATQPTSAAARSVVQQRGANVASVLNSFDGRLTDLRAQTMIRLDNATTRVNTLLDHVAELNGRIVSSEVDGTTASDLRDQRDQALDELSQFGNVRVVAARDGSEQVLLGNSAVVDGTTARHIQSTIDPATGKVGLRLSTSTEPMLPVGGTTQAMVDFMNNDLTEVGARLDAVAQGLVTQVNALHRTGEVYPPNGTPAAAGDFFDPALTRARDIRLDAAVAGSPLAIAAAVQPSAGNPGGPGDNTIALAMANLRSAPGQVSFLNGQGVTESDTFGNFYRDLASRVGTRVTSAAADAQVHQALATQADGRRKSISGVNVDEELTTLMRAQQAYAAAAKVISTAEEMMKTLVEMT